MTRVIHTANGHVVVVVVTGPASCPLKAREQLFANGKNICLPVTIMVSAGLASTETASH